VKSSKSRAQANAQLEGGISGVGKETCAHLICSSLGGIWGNWRFSVHGPSQQVWPHAVMMNKAFI